VYTVHIRMNEEAMARVGPLCCSKKQDMQCTYVYRNTEMHSCNHYCSGKPI